MGNERSKQDDAVVDEAGRQRPVPGGALFELQRSAGNAAVASLLQRKPDGGGHADPATQRLQAVLDELEARASEHANTIGVASKGSTKALKAASVHLQGVTANYKTAWTAFSEVLRKADEHAARQERLDELVLGLAIGTVIGAFGPQLMLLKSATGAARSWQDRAGSAFPELAKTWDAKVVESGADEAAEAAAGAAVDRARGDGAGDTKPLAGPAPGEVFETALSQLTEMISLLPEMEDRVIMLKDVSREALKLARRLGEGKGGDAAEVDQRIATFQALTASGEQLAATARSSLTQIERLAAQVLAVPLEDAGKIEDRLWTNWIAHLQPEQAKALLGNREIRNYLKPKGMLNFTPMAVEMIKTNPHNRSDRPVNKQKTVRDAQARWLRDRGLEPGPTPSVTQSRFKAQVALGGLRRKLVGKTARVRKSTTPGAAGHWVDVGDERVPLSVRSSRKVANGQVVQIVDLQIPYHLQADNVILDVWKSSDFEAEVESTGP